MEYDVIIIGGGPGGYHAADILGREGKKCLLFEKRNIGGVCLNEGCIPTKSLLYSAKKNTAQADAVKQKNKSVEILVNGVASSLKKSGVKTVNGEAEIVGAGNGVFIVESEGARYSGKKLIIASGSEPILPPVEGLEKAISSGTVLTSREILDLEKVPESLVIIGGGVIGLEMAAYYKSVGSSVTVIEMENSIGGPLDKDISSLLQKQLEADGVEIILNGRVTEILKDSIKYIKDDKEEKKGFTKILLSTGRKPVFVKGIDSLQIDKNKAGIKTDDKCRTNIVGVYAVGDVTGSIMLAHVAYRQAEVAVNDILGIKDVFDSRAVPSVIYTHPEVAWAGISEETAAAGGFDIEVRKVSVNMSGRHVVENGIANGICKLIIDKKDGIILGGGLISSYASEIIYTLVLIIQNKIPVSSLKKTIFPHPTVCEVLKEAIF